MKVTDRAMGDSSGMWAGEAALCWPSLGCGSQSWEEPWDLTGLSPQSLSGLHLSIPESWDCFRRAASSHGPVADCLPSWGGHIASLVPSLDLGPGICCLSVSHHLGLASHRGQRLLIHKGRAFAWAFSLKQPGQLWGCQLPGYRVSECHKQWFWERTRFLLGGWWSCFLLMYASLGQLGTASGSPLGTCLLHQALPGSQLEACWHLLPFSDLKTLPSVIDQVIAMK